MVQNGFMGDSMTSEQQHGYIFTHEDNDYKLRKVSGNYECWKNGVFKFVFTDKLSFQSHLYESMLTDCFGTKGFGSVDVFFDIHYKCLLNLLKFLELYGEDRK